MDEQTLTALKGSIEKWEKIVKGENGDFGAKNCALCKLFNTITAAHDGTLCAGCPVAELVEESGCCGTPYEEWCRYVPITYDNNGNKERRVFDEESQILAEQELNFLKSLLPKEAA